MAQGRNHCPNTAVICIRSAEEPKSRHRTQLNVRGSPITDDSVRIAIRKLTGISPHSRLVASSKGRGAPHPLRSGLDVQSPDTESLILDDNDGSACEFRRACVDHSKESRIHGGRCLISKPKSDDAWSLAMRGRENVSEIQIEGKHNSTLSHSFRAIWDREDE